MLRTNLSTRPFYNERGIHLLLGLAALVVVVFTLFNLTQLALLTRRQTSLSAEASAADQRAQELRTHAAQLRQAIDARQLEAISVSAREANEIIGQRLFSWTDLLNRLETTLPDDVRITSLRPRVDGPDIVVQMTVTGRSIEDVGQFMTNLEETSTFSDVVPLEDSPAETGGVQVSLEGKYAAVH